MLLSLCPSGPTHTSNNFANNSMAPKRPSLRQQFRSASQPAASISSAFAGLNQKMTAMANTNVFDIQRQRPTNAAPLTMGGTLEGLQRDWMLRESGGNNNGKNRLQQELLFQLKQCHMSSTEIPPSSFKLPVEILQIKMEHHCHRPHSPPHFPVQFDQKNSDEKLPLLFQSVNQPKNQSLQTTAAEQSLHQFLRLFNGGQHCFPVRLCCDEQQQNSQKKAEINKRSKLFEWRIRPADLEPIERQELMRCFAIGLPVEKQPYSQIACQGLKDLFSTPNGPADLSQCLPFVLPQLRLAFGSSHPWKKLEALELLRDMAQLRGIGPQLVPYLGTLLPTLKNILTFNCRRATRASTDTQQNQRDRLVNAVDRTLLTLEQRGGPSVGAIIKQIIPEYQPLYN